MKQPKQLTRTQKEFLTRKHLDWKNYGFVSENGETITVWNKIKGVVEIINKGKA